MRLDHVLIAVTDLSAAAMLIEARDGLASVEGGRHPGWGTANRIVPLGDTYLELIAVLDAAKAAGSTFGRWVASDASDRGRPIGWAVNTNNLESIARRLSLVVHAGSRATPTGEVLRWRNAGIEQAAAEPSLPFFIEWSPGAQHPGRTPVSHRAGAVHMGRLVIQGDPGHLEAWLGEHDLPIMVQSGSPALSRVVISADSGEITFAG